VKIIRSFLITVVIFFQFVVCQNSIQKEIDAFSKIEALKNASISFLAVDLETSLTIAELNPTTSLPAASTAKLFSTSTALKVLGPDFHPSTTIYFEGKISQDSILDGNIWVKGGGDPTLGSVYFNEKGEESDFLETWVNEVKKNGIKQIKGCVIVDGSEYSYLGVPDGWTWSDIGNYYGAGPSGIILYDNMLKYHFQTGTPENKTTLVSTFPKVDNLNFNNQIIASSKRGDNSYIYGAPYSYERFGIGELPSNRKNFIVKGSIPDPEIQLATELKDKLESDGIKVEKGAKSYRLEQNNFINNYDSFTKLLSHPGKTVSEIVTLTNQKSINLFAEQLLYLFSKNDQVIGSTSKGLEIIENCWGKEVDFNSMYLTDGSGLSRSNAISASHFCDLLSSIYKSSIFMDFENSLPLAGCSGTLKNVCKNQLGHGRIRAKSGSLTRVKSYAGYIDSKSGKKLAFSIIVNNFNCSSFQLVKYMEVLFNQLSEY
jgi:serine-type D-Ala-D-Ala carboxypeptidase/endopeptidase (penicillin-binding protein 4)